jgi:anaerobic selenocysteine-containing dehydrogenase
MLSHRSTACPHDCPSTCALEVEVIDARTIGSVRGARENTYTDGVICAKVARYAERIHHPDRLTRPLARVGAKGSGRLAPIYRGFALAAVGGGLTRATGR